MVEKIVIRTPSLLPQWLLSDSKDQMLSVLSHSILTLSHDINGDEQRRRGATFRWCSLPTVFSSLRKSKVLHRSNFDVSRTRSVNAERVIARDSMGFDNQMINDVSLDWGINAAEEDEDMGSPWEGAIIYKRDPSSSHVEYCTTLERLGIAKCSSDISKLRASEMGLRVTKAMKDYPQGTPVLISVDVTRKKQKLRLDGIIKTVIALNCNSCGEPAAKAVYSNFSLLLTEEPTEEPDEIDFEAAFEDDPYKAPKSSFQLIGDEDSDIDWEDRLHFPPEDSKIDISKQVRDLVHLEVAMDVMCDPGCKGLCFQCGTNWNEGTCNCSKRKTKTKEANYSPFRDLMKQLRSNS